MSAPSSPDHRHRCYAEVQPAPRALAHQEAYCLSSAFPVCPTFQDWARREAAQARSAGRAAAAPPAISAAVNDEREPERGRTRAPMSTPSTTRRGGGGPGDADDDRARGPRRRTMTTSRSSTAIRRATGPPRRRGPRVAPPARECARQRWRRRRPPERRAGLPGQPRSGARARRECRGPARRRIAGRADRRRAVRRRRRRHRHRTILVRPRRSRRSRGRRAAPRPARRRVRLRGRPSRSRRPPSGAYPTHDRDGSPADGQLDAAHGRSSTTARPGSSAQALRGLPDDQDAGGPAGLSRGSRSGRAPWHRRAGAVLPAGPARASVAAATGASPTPQPDRGRCATATPEPTPSPSRRRRSTSIKAGDTLSKIAKKFDLTLDELLAANKETIKDPDKIAVGRRDHHPGADRRTRSTDPSAAAPDEQRDPGPDGAALRRAASAARC